MLDIYLCIVCLMCLIGIVKLICVVSIVEMIRLVILLLCVINGLLELFGLILLVIWMCLILFLLLWCRFEICVGVMVIFGGLLCWFNCLLKGKLNVNILVVLCNVELFICNGVGIDFSEIFRNVRLWLGFVVIIDVLVICFCDDLLLKMIVYVWLNVFLIICLFVVI